MLLKQGQQNFVKEETSAHWYKVMPDGSVVEQHDADLRRARKEKLFPSPTSIEKEVRANPVLSRWIKNQVAKAFVNNPRLEGEDDQPYAERILKLADGVRDNAADLGTRIHAAIENDGTSDPAILPFYEAYLPWHADNIETTIGSEVKLADETIGVAGKVDRIVQHKQHGLVILDYKTKKVRDGKAEFYDSFSRQLSFYAGAYRRMHGVLPRIMSVVIDSKNPSRPYDKLYSMEEQQEAYIEFLSHVWLWCSSKDYWPAGKWNPSFPFDH